jgi:hypothetical protein
LLWLAFSLLFFSLPRFFFRLELFLATGEGHLAQKYPELVAHVVKNIEIVTGSLDSFDAMKRTVEILGKKHFLVAFAERGAAACWKDGKFGLLGIRKLVEMDLEPIVELLAPYAADLPLLSVEEWQQATKGIEELKSQMFEDIVAVHTAEHFEKLPANVMAAALPDSLRWQCVALKVGAGRPRIWSVSFGVI